MAILFTEQFNTNGIIVENQYYDSKALGKTSYNYDTNQLTATFQKGNVYTYQDVPVGVYEKLKTEKSAGVYFQAEIANSYTFKQKGNVGDQFVANELSTKLPKSDDGK